MTARCDAQMWATKDETPQEGRTLQAAPSKKIRGTETCTRHCERKRWCKIGDSFVLVKLECEHEVTRAPEATRLLHQPRSPAARLVIITVRGQVEPLDATQHSVSASCSVHSTSRTLDDFYHVKSG